MFDWNDEELANIIWGEAGDSDDHIVPYREASEDLRNKKEWHQEAAGNKLTEQKKPEAKIDFHGRKLESSSNPNNSGGISVSGFGANSWPDLSLSNAVKSDQYSLGNEVSKNISEICKYSSPRNEEAGQLEKDAQIFENADEGKEQGDFVDYGWANIGSFDDLDRIFSNDDPIFGHVNLDNADELWSSSKNASNGSAPFSSETQNQAGVLKNRSEPMENKAEYVQHGDQSFPPSYVKIGGPASHEIQTAHVIRADLGYDGGRSKPIIEQQMNQDMVGRTNSVATGLAAENVATASAPTAKAFGQKNLFKARKKSHGKQGQALQNFNGNWLPSTESSRQFENQAAPYIIQSSTASILGQQKHLQGAGSLYQNITYPYVASPVYGNSTNAYPAMPMPSQPQPGDLTHQSVLSGYEVSSGKSVDSVKPLTMTPQEKIEKLRRRQQMQAMLAIKKQQQQLGHQVPGTNKSIAQKSLLEIQSNSGADQEIDDLSSLPALDPPIEQDDCNTVSVAADDYFVEDTILYRLQDIISKLDIQIRLCIRDSLFRLAQSAMQRHYTSDTSSTNKSSREELEVVAREESNYQNSLLRYARTPDIETETNPIDRAVAHLLFHRHLELTGNHSDKLESHVSAKVQFESKTSNLVNLPAASLSDEDLKSSLQFSHQGFKNPYSLFEAQRTDQFRNSPRIDTSENASNNEPEDVEGSPEV